MYADVNGARRKAAERAAALKREREELQRQSEAAREAKQSAGDVIDVTGENDERRNAEIKAQGVGAIMTSVSGALLVFVFPLVGVTLLVGGLLWYAVVRIIAGVK